MGLMLDDDGGLLCFVVVEGEGGGGGLGVKKIGVGVEVASHLFVPLRVLAAGADLFAVVCCCVEM